MLKLIAPLVPYLAVTVGLSFFRSAWVAILGYHAGMALVLWLSGSGKQLRSPYRMGDFRLALLSTTVGVSGGAALYLLWPYLSVPPDSGLFVREIGLTEQTWPFFIAYYVGANPVIEEFYWRSYLTSDRKLVTVNDMLFAGYHVLVLTGKMDWEWLVVVFIILSAAAWFWRRMNKLTGSLLPSLISHIAADLTIISTIYIMTSG